MSSGKTVSFTLSASEREAVQAYRKLIREGPEALTKALDAYVRKSKQGANETEQSWKGSMGRMAASYVSIDKAVGLIARGWDAVLARMEEAERRGRQVSLTLEEAGRKLAIQGGLSPEQEAAATRTALEIGQKYGFKGEAVLSGFTQLISSGGSPQDVIAGGSGRALVETAVASNLPRDAESLRNAAQAASLFLTSTGQRATPENIRKLGIGTQALFANTNFQLPELARFAEESGQLSSFSGASQEELLGTFALLRQELGAAKGSSAFRSFATKLVGLRSDSVQGEGLAEIGLGVEDVDFIGESYQDVIRRLSGALQNADPAVAARVQKSLFGEEGGSAANAILRPGMLAKIQEKIAVQSDDTSFNAALARGTSGASAAVAKLEAQQETALNSSGAQRRAVFREALSAENAERISRTSGVQKIGANVDAAFFSFMYDALTQFGVDPERALPNSRGVGDSTLRAAVENRAADALRASIDANTRALEAQGGTGPQQRADFQRTNDQ